MARGAQGRHHRWMERLHSRDGQAGASASRGAEDATPQSLRWRVVLGVTLLALWGCGTETLAVASMATIINTDKLPSDYIAEIATGQDCNTLRAKQDGGQVCRDPNAGQVYERPAYCYRTLGQITCYDKPDPYGASTRAVR